MQAILVLLIGIAVVSAAPPERWVNGYDQVLNYVCKSHQSVSLIISVHDNKREDRVWDFGCQNTFSNPGSCSWTGYINDFDQEFTFTCPFGSVLSGMDSYHDNKKEDRRWRFLCCQGETTVQRNCKWSGYLNDFDGYLRWDAPPNHYLVGAQSYHDNYREPNKFSPNRNFPQNFTKRISLGLAITSQHRDRRWNYYSCEKN